MLTLLINESNPLDGLFANATTGGIGSVPDISVADEGQAVSVQSFTRAGGIITDSFVTGDVLHIGIGDGVNAPVCYVALSSASPATGTMPINTDGMVALFAATVANQLSLTLAVVRTRGAYTNTIFSAPIVIRRSAINISTAVPTPSILGTGVAAALQVAINTALGFVRLDASARLPAVDASQLTNVPNELPSQTGNNGKYLTTNGTATSWATVTGGVTSITGTANEITVTGTTTPTLSLPSALTFTGKTVTGGTFTGGAFNGTVGATTPSTVAGTTGTFSGAVTGATFNAVTINQGLGNDGRSVALGASALAASTTGANNVAIGFHALELLNIGGANVAVGLGALSSNVSGDNNTAIGISALGFTTGSGNVAIGSDAGQYETGSNAFYIDNQDRTNTAGDKAKALIYGTFATTAAAQQLTINAGTITLNGSAVTATSYAGAGTGLTGTASGLTAGNATLAATVTVANEATDTTCFPLFATAATGSLAVKSNAGLTFNSATGLLSATGLAGAFNGTVGATTPSTGAFTTISGTGSLTLGANGGTAGSIQFNGSTSGNAVIGASATGVLTLPDHASGAITLTGAATTPTTGVSIGFSQTRLQIFYSSGFQARLDGGNLTASRIISFPDAAGTLLLSDGSGANLTALNASNISTGTLADARNTVSNTTTTSMANLATVGTLTGGATGAGFTVALSTSTITGSLADARLSANVPLLNAANTFTAANAFSLTPGASASAFSATGAIYAAGTGTTNFPHTLIQPSAATASTTWPTAGTAIGINLTSTTPDFIHCKAAGTGFGGGVGTDYFRVKGDGTVNCAGAIYIRANATQSVYGWAVGISSIVATSGWTMLWAASSTDAAGAKDTSLSRNAAGVLQFGTSAANASGSWLATNGTLSGTLAVTGATTLTGNLTSNGALISTPQALTGAGAVNVTTLTTAVTTTAPAQALTLADGTNGQIKTIVHQALSGGGTWVLTPTTKTGYTTITSIAVGETCTLQFFTTIGWCILSLRGAIAA